jgi:integrase
LNPSLRLERHVTTGEKRVNKDELEKYLTYFRLNGISTKWFSNVSVMLINYLNYVNWIITENKTLEYLKFLQEKYSVTAYCKKAYQIRKYLTYLDIEWARNIKPPSEPEYLPKRVTFEDIQNTLDYFKGHPYFKQVKSVILLGTTSGLRAEELYQLKPDDIDLDK